MKEQEHSLNLTARDIIDSHERAVERGSLGSGTGASPMDIIGIRIGTERRRAGFNLHEFTEKTGATREDLVDIELGTANLDIIMDNSDRIEDALKLKPGAILFSLFSSILDED
jgi:hypothetical protein